MGIKRNLFRDILRDINSKKYSMTKFTALIILSLLIVLVITGIIIMIINKETDHILIAELIALLLTLLGFKNAGKKAINNIKKKKDEDEIDSGDLLIREENDELG